MQEKFSRVVIVQLHGTFQVEAIGHGMFVLVDNSMPGYVVSLQGCQAVYEAVDKAKSFLKKIEETERRLGNLLDAVNEAE